MLMRQVVLISGRTCNGKSRLASHLQEEFGYRVVRTSDILKEIATQRGRTSDRLSLQALGDVIDAETKHAWVRNATSEAATALPESVPLVIDNIRNGEQLEHFRRQHDWKTVHVHLYAPSAELERRFAQKLTMHPG